MTLSSPNVCSGPLAGMAMSFWRNAHTARHPVQQFASIAQAHLWGLATSPAASERIRQAAYTHLVKTSDHMVHNEFLNSKPSAY